MKRRALLATTLLACISIRASDETRLEMHLRAIRWDSYQDQAVRLLQKYLRIDTSNPPGNEQAAAEFFHKLFDSYGIPNTVFTYAPARANLYAVLKGDGTLRPLVLLNHMDVVRAEPRNWKAPPFSGQILNGEVYGRGALDMKDEGLLQAMVMLIAARERLPLKRDLVFLATADEEVGDAGSAWVLKNRPDLVRGAEYLITEGGTNLVYPVKGTVYNIGVAERILPPDRGHREGAHGVETPRHPRGSQRPCVRQGACRGRGLQLPDPRHGFIDRAEGERADERHP
ncbi:MAG: hypothetical protein DMG23_12965 [Acidobacteria bacterium]|nr:MAG: hypothetical protein DMG23_12965 [Acidobacteriota bacterium]